MAKHRSESTQIRIAPWIWTVFIVLIALALCAGCIFYFSKRASTDNSAETSFNDCSQHTTLSIIADPAARPTAERLAHDYAQSKPVVHESCVTPHIIYANTAQATQLFNTAPSKEASTSLPAVWIPAGADSQKALSGAGAQPDSSVVVDKQQLGIVAHNNTQQVIYPAQSTWSAFVAAEQDSAELSPEDYQNALSQLGTNQNAPAVAAPESMKPNGTHFQPIANVAVDFPLITMSSSAQVGEDQARAAQDFKQFAAKDSQVKALSSKSGEQPSPQLTELALTQSATASATLPAIDLATQGGETSAESSPASASAKNPAESSAASASSTSPSAAAQTPASEPDNRVAPQSVLLLLDSSASMQPYFDDAKTQLSQALLAAGQKNITTSLWNFSSPSGSRNMPYRDNVDLSIGDKGQQSARILNQISSGGGSYLYDAMVASLLNSTMSGTPPQRIVIVTSSRDDGHSISARSALAQIKALEKKKPVAIDVIAVGNNSDPILKDVSSLTGGRYYSVGSTTGDDFAHCVASAFGTK